MTANPNLSANLSTEEQLKTLFSRSKDVLFQTFRFEQTLSSEVVLIYNAGLTDSRRIAKTISELEELYWKRGFAELTNDHVYGALPLVPIGKPVSAGQIAEWVFEGDILLLFSETAALFRMNAEKRPQRNPEESSTEVTIKGPKDGFVEDIGVNVALIRKRIRSQSLCYETFVIGRRTKTKVGLLYIEDILSPEVLAEAKKRLSAVDVDGIYSTEQLKELIADVKYPIFPLLDFTGRPDKAVYTLLAGRFVIIVDGNPMAIIGPSPLVLQLKSPEDIDFNFLYVSFTRFIRAVSFGLSLLLPGFWVALTAFHQDQIPFRLMTTIASTRIGLPFSPQMELFILLLLLEIFREAGLRLPSTIGSTLTVVGGLIIGDAAIRAGLVSPSVVVVGAITAVCSVTLVNQSLTAAVSVIRLVLFIVSSFLGMFGMLLGVMLLVMYMSRLRSFGVPYLSPLSPLFVKDVLQSVFRFPWTKVKHRPKNLDPHDPDHQQGEDSREGRH